LQYKNAKSIIAMALGLVALSSCQSSHTTKADSTQSVPASSAKQTPAANEAGSATSNDTIPSASHRADSVYKFEQENGKSLFKIAHDKGKGTILGADDQVVVSFNEFLSAKTQLLQVSDATGNCVGYVLLDGQNNLRIEDSNRQELFKLKFENDGHFKLKDSHDSVIYKVKSEEYGLKILEGEDGKVLFKVKAGDGKVKLKTASGETILTSRSNVKAPVVACFGFGKLTKPQQYGVAYALEFLR